MSEPVSMAARDMVGRRVGLLVWGLPLVAIVVTTLSPVAPVTRGLILALALLWAGAACVTNARRSGRLHCYITGPFFALLGVVSLLYGAGILPLGERGWLWLGTALAVGAPLLIIVPERIWGKYSARGRQRCC